MLNCQMRGGAQASRVKSQLLQREGFILGQIAGWLPNGPDAGVYIYLTPLKVSCIFWTFLDLLSSDERIYFPCFLSMFFSSWLSAWILIQPPIGSSGVALYTQLNKDCVSFKSQDPCDFCMSYINPDVSPDKKLMPIPPFLLEASLDIGSCRGLSGIIKTLPPIRHKIEQQYLGRLS